MGDGVNEKPSRLVGTISAWSARGYQDASLGRGVSAERILRRVRVEAVDGSVGRCAEVVLVSCGQVGVVAEARRPSVPDKGLGDVEVVADSLGRSSPPGFHDGADCRLRNRRL